MADSEVGVLSRTLKRRWLTVVLILAAGTVIGGLLGASQPTTYKATTTVRMQYPTGLETVPKGDDFAAWMESQPIAEAASQRSKLTAAGFSVQAAVPPSNKRLVVIDVSGQGRSEVEKYTDALVQSGRAKAESVVAEQLNALTEAAAANKKALAYVDEIEKRTEELLSGAKSTGNVTDETAVLGLAMQAKSNKAGLLDNQASIVAELSELMRGVEIHAGPTVTVDLTRTGPIAGAVAGSIIALAIVVIWLLVATRKERAAVRADSREG